MSQLSNSLQKPMLLILVLGILGCQSSQTPDIETTQDSLKQKGLRQLGFDVVNETPSASFMQNIDRAKSVGASFVGFHIGWSSIEASTPNDCSSPGNYTDPGLSAFNSVVPSTGVSLALSIVPYTTNIKMMPSNLMNTNIDDPLVICRYKKMLDYVFTKIPNLNLVILLISNEMEVHTDTLNSSFWSRFWTFYSEVSVYAKTLRPGLKVGLSATMEGLIGTSGNPNAKDGYQALNQASDYIAVNYYPKAPDLSVADPQDIGNAFDELVSVYSNTDKKIFVQELGYQSGAINGSSESRQAEAIHEFFKVWDKYDTRISHVNIVRMNDVSMSVAEQTANDYGFTVGNPSRDRFVDYIRTLGFVAYDGSVKQGFVQLKSETLKRGW